LLHIVAEGIARVKGRKRAVRFRAVPEWLTPSEAAKYLKVDRTTIYRWEEAGLIRSYPLPTGRGRRFDRDELDAVLRGERKEGTVDGSGRESK
jgi:excisionase family DNA binding protein